MIVFGITGPTGSGKTTALQCIAEKGGTVLDLDAVYHQLLKTDKNLIADLDARFPGVITDGTLDRKALGSIVFADQQALMDLNAITGKYIMAETDRLLAQAREEGRPMAAIDAINLLEGDLPFRCTHIIAVTAPVDIRVKRLMQRDNISEEYARLRISAQPPNEYYEELCDFTLRNGLCTQEEFTRQCHALLDELLAEEKGI